MLAFFLSLHHWYGVWDPEHIYPSNVSLATSPLRNIPAMLFDVKRGALIYNPALLLIFVGLAPWFKRNRRMLILAILAILPSMAILSVFNAWQGGYAPTGRYLVDFLPVFFPAMAFALMVLKQKWQKALAGLLILATLFITIEVTLIKAPYINNNQYRPGSAFFNKLEQQTGMGFQHLLPNYSNRVTLDDKHGSEKLLLGWLVLIVLTVYGYYLSESSGSVSPQPAKPVKSGKSAKARAHRS
jgi:hypothetical protein